MSALLLFTIAINVCVLTKKVSLVVVPNPVSHYIGGSGGMASTSGPVRAPRPFSIGDDFALWIRRFEAYARAVNIAEGTLGDALLALLDDAAFRAFDLLELPEATLKDYKKLTEELRKRFAPTTGLHELRFSLGHREQGPTETIDEYADALVLLVNRAYPGLDAKTRMGLALDQFISGIANEHIQDSLLQSLPKDLDTARETAKRLNAALTTRKQMRARRQLPAPTLPAPVSQHVRSTNLVGEHESGDAQNRMTAYTGRDDALERAVRDNTDLLQKLLRKLDADDGRDSRRRRRRGPVTCWQCGEQGHVKRNCPNPAQTDSGNDQRLTSAGGQRQPRSQ